MSTEDKNKGLFDDIKDSVDLGHTLDPKGQEDSEVKKTVDPREILERELIKRLSAEKHRLAAELEIQFKEASSKRVKEQGQKFKELLAKEQELLAQEKLKYEKALKEKYQRVMKTMLQEKEQQLAEKIKNQNYASTMELRQQIDKLQQELAQQQQATTLQISEAKITAKQEQERASKALYDNVLQAERDAIVKQAEDRLQAEFARREIEMKREHEIALKKHTAKLMQAYEEKLQQAVAEQEQDLTRNQSEQLTRQSELFNHRIQQEVNAAVAAATSKLELEYVKEKQNLNAKIESLRPEVEANRLRMRVEVEKEIRAEFDIKYAEYKLKVDAAKKQELEALMTAETQKLAEAMQEENMVVLKYKEREIREKCTAEFEQQLQATVHKNLQEQEKRLQAEHEQQLEVIAKKLKEDHALQVQAEVIQERARITEKATNDKKILLQQQEANMQEQFNSELAHKLAMQAQALNQQHQAAMATLEARLQEIHAKPASRASIEPFASSIPDLIESIAPKTNHFAQEQDLPHLVSAPPTVDPALFAAEKRAALEAQYKTLQAQFAAQLQAERLKWEEERGTSSINLEAELEACEKKLRREFQGILEQQRLLASANFAKQRDVEIRGTIAKYKQKILNEMETARLNDLAAAEQSLKEQYAARMQQHGDLARVEIERTKEALLAEQHAKIKAAVDLQMEAMHKQQDLKFAQYAKQQDEKLAALVEEERKQLQIKFAQDKANLIKEVTAKFTREKHIAMNKYETELRENLYREMVKQKDFIQSKFTHAQEAALQEQKRRLESQHKHEIERIKQGFFDPSNEHAKHDEIIAERNVEQLADRILAKFNKT